jgi:hypothetical protein
MRSALSTAPQPPEATVSLHRVAFGGGRSRSRHAPAEDLVAHAAQESALPLRLAGGLRLQLLDPRIGALERLILNQRRLHERRLRAVPVSVHQQYSAGDPWCRCRYP